MFNVVAERCDRAALHPDLGDRESNGPQLRLFCMSTRFRILVAGVCLAVIGGYCGLVVKPRADTEASQKEVQEFLGSCESVQLKIPSYPESHSAVVSDRQMIAGLRDQFRPVSATAVDSSYAVGAGGNSIQVLCPDKEHPGLLVGFGWALFVSPVPGGEDRWIMFQLDEDDYLKSCASAAGFAYPLLSDLYPE
jgi:hypothetical protein